MKIVEQTSTHLILKKSVLGTWLIRLIGLLFFLLGCGGIFFIVSEIITENNFPPAMGVFFPIFCTFMGGFALFWSDTRLCVFDKNEQQLNFKSKRLLKHINRKYSFDEVLIKVKRNPSKTKKIMRISTEFNSLIPIRIKLEPAFIVVLELPTKSHNHQEIYIYNSYTPKNFSSGNFTLPKNNYLVKQNYFFTRNEAVIFANVIRDFINTA